MIIKQDLFNSIATSQEQLTQWRRYLHAHPETAFEEVETARFIAEKLRSFGIEVHEGLAKTGVVGTLRNGNNTRSIGLRADMDALDIIETNTFAHKSKIHGKMHGCGHDGHSTMLLGAAKYLAEHKNFDGTIHFIFQPAEEAAGGAKVMIEDGLFDMFPVEAVFGLHNMPGIPVGHFAVKPGPMLAGFNSFDIKIQGTGGHGAMPHKTVDPIVIASEIVTALQTIASRTIDPLKPAVISVTKFNAGETYNVIPDSASIGGGTRHFHMDVQDQLEHRITEIATHIAQAHGATATVTYNRQYPPTINSQTEAALCERVLKEAFGPERVKTDFDPLMGSEDFAYMLQEKPGCYILAGNGDGEGSCMVHNPSYDFNDEGLAWGATYWVALAEHLLAQK